MLEAVEALSSLYHGNMTQTVLSVAFGQEETANVLDISLDLFRLLVEKTDRTVLDFGNQSVVVSFLLNHNVESFKASLESRISESH